MAESKTQSATEMERYLDPKVLAKITRLDLRARHVVEGFINGLHRSPFHGFSVEFATHREYVPGDDIKHIDWKVQARTDRFYIKQYEEETNLQSTFLVDCSESMHYGADSISQGKKEGLTKYDYACATAASLAFLLQQQQDAVGLALFDEELLEYISPSGSPQQLKRMLHAMQQVTPRKATKLAEVCHAVAEKASRRGLICLVSDLFVDTDGVMQALERFRHYNHEVVVLHVLDEDELAFPFAQTTQFDGLEDMGKVTVTPRALREAYCEEIETFCHDVKRRCVAARIDYVRISTTDHLDAALCGFLAARSAAVRKTSAKR